jgi:hypothetical protein
LKIANFQPGQTVQLPVNYKTPNNQKIEIFGKIDDGDDYQELIEKNNTEIALLTEALSVDNLTKNCKVIVAPNPFTDWVRFTYELPAGTKEVSISIFTQKGSEVVQFIHCPIQTGSNSIDWSPSQLTPGNYIYRISVIGIDGKLVKIPGILVKTER